MIALMADCKAQAVQLMGKVHRPSFHYYRVSFTIVLIMVDSSFFVQIQWVSHFVLEPFRVLTYSIIAK